MSKFKIRKPAVTTFTREQLEVEMIIRSTLDHDPDWNNKPIRWQTDALARVVFETMKTIESSVNNELDGWDEAERIDWLDLEVPTDPKDLPF